MQSHITRHIKFPVPSDNEMRSHVTKHINLSPRFGHYMHSHFRKDVKFTSNPPPPCDNYMHNKFQKIHQTSRPPLTITCIVMSQNLSIFKGNENKDTNRSSTLGTIRCLTWARDGGTMGTNDRLYGTSTGGRWMMMVRYARAMVRTMDDVSTVR